MQKGNTKKLVTAGLLTALGLLLPYFTSHAFSIPGTILLPMHIPVLLCGLLCGARFGALCGILIPIMSSLLTGMPTSYPMLPIMATQLLALGSISGYLYQNRNKNVYASIFSSSVVGWAVYGLMYATLLFFAGGELKALSVSAALVQGIPGIAVQLILVPFIMVSIKKLQEKMPRVEAEANETLADAVKLIKSGKATCIVIKNASIIHAAKGWGVSPILHLYDNEPLKLEQAFVVDKIIGKAAAMLLIQAGVSKVYGEIMSKSANEFLIKHAVEVQYGRCIDVITARDGRGICPIEKSVLYIDVPEEGVITIRNTIKTLMERAV